MPNFDLITDISPNGLRYSQADLAAMGLANKNNFYGPVGADIVSSIGAPSVDQLLAMPFYAGFGGTVDTVAFNITTGAGAGGKARCGIYDSDNSGLGLAPRNLLIDGGEFDATVTGLKSTTVSVAMREGETYWLVFLCGVNAPTVTTFTSGWHVFGRDNTFAAQSALVKTGFAYAALPASFPSPVTGFSNPGTPLVCVRFATYNRLRRYGP